MIELEYIEFFKSRAKVRKEWNNYVSKAENKLQEVIETIQQYENHLVKMNENDSKLG